MFHEHPDFYVEDWDDVLPAQCPFCGGNEGHFSTRSGKDLQIVCTGCDQNVTDVMPQEEDTTDYEASLPQDPGYDVW